ncbi:MAG: hypothetical protein JXB14_01745 [Candidatus Altiarchaeota archaeon]|nr:hypothetical protein [Candidatus Altiarchaeota archaeon]
MKFARNTLIGSGLIVVAVILALLINSIGGRIMELNNAECDCGADEVGGFCPHSVNTLPIEIYLGYTVSAVLAIAGAYLIFSDFRSSKLKSESADNWRKVISSLNGEEKRIYELLASSDGVMFQSDLVEKSEMPKVKVSRILDRLEARNLLERRRRGMSNAVVLKNK